MKKIKKSQAYEVKEEVWKLLYSLRKASHSPTCKQVFDHPKRHEECRSKLDLQVALTWELADEFSDLYSYLSRGYWRNPLTIPEVNDHLQKISIVVEACGKLASHPDFKLLRKRVKEANIVIELVTGILQDT